MSPQGFGHPLPFSRTPETPTPQAGSTSMTSKDPWQPRLFDSLQRRHRAEGFAHPLPFVLRGQLLNLWPPLPPLLLPTAPWAGTSFCRAQADEVFCCTQKRKCPSEPPLLCPPWGAALPPLLLALSALATAARARGHRCPPDAAFLVAPHPNSQVLQSHCLLSLVGGTGGAAAPGPAGPLSAWGAEREAPSYPKADLPVGAHLQVEAVGAVPVAVDDVHFAVAVEVRQSHPSPMLVGVVHTWEEEQRPSGQCPCGSRDAELAGAP